jgi:signal transduction histidine kinase
VPAGTGSGLGLAIARSIVEANEGRIAISNVPGGGALVRLRFPPA